MNPHEQHSAGMRQYEALMQEPVNGKTGGKIAWDGKDFSATVSHFDVRQVSGVGGSSPSFFNMGEAIVQKSVCGDAAFKTNQIVTATAPGGSKYECKIFSVVDLPGEWRLHLQDKNFKV